MFLVFIFSLFLKAVNILFKSTYSYNIGFVIRTFMEFRRKSTNMYVRFNNIFTIYKVISKISRRKHNPRLVPKPLCRHLFGSGNELTSEWSIPTSPTRDVLLKVLV